MSSDKITPKHPSYKFLTRNLKMTCEECEDFKRVCIKRLYLKKIAHESGPKAASQEIVYRPTINHKIFKTLKHVHLPSLDNPAYVHQKFKNAKNLKILHVDSYFVREKGLEKFAFYIKKLPINIQVINLDVSKGEHKVRKDYYDIAKSIRYLPKLQAFRRYFYFDSQQRHVEKEMMTYSQSASRLKNMKELVYDFEFFEQSGFQRAMRRGLVYPRITGLKMYMNEHYLADYYKLQSYFEAESSDDEEYSFLDFKDMNKNQKRAYKMLQNDIKIEDEEKNDDLVLKNNPQEDFDSPDENVQFPKGISQDFIANSIMREQIKPFYRFELFPDLKVLEIVHEEYLFPLGSFVIDGFAALKKLECLKINFYTRSMGSGYIFKGLSKLPLLKEFSLSLTFIANEEWILLEQFLSRQDNLEVLSLNSENAPSTRTRYLQQNSLLGKTIRCLENKSLLKSLELTSNFWSIEAISNGLSHLKMMNQFQVLKLTVSDDTVTSQTKSNKRVEGLCTFIKNQKESIKTLHLHLSLVLEASIGTHLAEAFSTAIQLRELDLIFNFPMRKPKIHKLLDYFKYDLQDEIPVGSKVELKTSKKWNPSVAKYIKRLENLETFIMNFDTLHDDDSTKWFVDIMTALPSLEKLQKIDIEVRHASIFWSCEKKMIAAMRDLKSIRNIEIKWKDPEFSSRELFRSLTSEIHRINHSQAQRCDLMF